MFKLNKLVSVRRTLLLTHNESRWSSSLVSRELPSLGAYTDTTLQLIATDAKSCGFELQVVILGEILMSQVGILANYVLLSVTGAT